MERYHPRVGLWSILLALPSWAVFLLNGIFGIFPAIIFADDGVGQKFHFWLFIQDRLLGGSPDPVWSDAGEMTTQEWLILSFALITTISALYCLRRRPEFGEIERSDDISQRETLEIGGAAIPMMENSGDAHTQAIVESVIGKEEILDQTVVAAALGEMGAIAAANAIDDELPFDEEDEELPLDEEEVESAEIEDMEVVELVNEEPEEEDIEWGVWDPDTSTKEVDEEPEIPEIPEIFREPDTPKSAPITPNIEPTNEIVLPEQIEPKIAEKISSMATHAADVTMSAAMGVASKTAKITENVVHRVRSKATKGVMPVRPAELPPLAEWDPTHGVWTLMGRPVTIAEKPEPEKNVPSWAVEEVEEPQIITNPVIEVPSIVDEKPRRKTPFIPELP
ncbi:MAG: hypothetical protein VX320_03240 [Candidatus Thermoplasmatota archaeon]|nr:hypothetical protein [Candidatus Thermoplasmatota archaeon]